MLKQKSILVVTLMLLVSLALLVGCDTTDPEAQIEMDTEVETEMTAEETTMTETPDVEFSMDSFVDVVDGEYFPQFSETELTVKKGDLVRINVNVTSGNHDFYLDEFDIQQATPTGEVTTIEFVADQAGEFVYYCNMPGHRDNGHFGTLTVVE